VLAEIVGEEINTFRNCLRVLGVGGKNVGSIFGAEQKWEPWESRDSKIQREPAPWLTEVRKGEKRDFWLF